MYDLKTVKRTLKQLKELEYQFEKTSKITGIKTRTIRDWYNKEKAGFVFTGKRKKCAKKGKWKTEQMNQVLDYYFNHGESITKAIKKFGYPSNSTLKYWVYKDKRYKRKRKLNTKTPVLYNGEDKIKIISSFASRDSSGENKAKEYNICRTTIYSWQKKLTGDKIMNSKKDKDKSKEDLIEEIKILKQEHLKLEMENKVLNKANEILKKEIGANYSSLTKKEKVLIVSALKDKYKIKELLEIVNLKKSTYFYEVNLLNFDKYSNQRETIKNIFYDNYMCYGYRRIKVEFFKKTNEILSEKVIRRIMKEEKLIVYRPKRKKYSSYEGEISPEVNNIVNRDFSASKPYEKALTDITEFSLSDGKVYLSPLIDCFTGSPITYKIGRSPNTTLTNSMLIEAHEFIKNNEIIIHSDRGFHYRVDSWIDLMNEYGYIRSMSKKGCSPDNSMCEGFFGTLKNEFFYPRNWSLVKCDDFILKLDDYLKWFINKRIKKKLNYLSPNDFMINYNK